jgi:hypothetical protein
LTKIKTFYTGAKDAATVTKPVLSRMFCTITAFLIFAINESAWDQAFNAFISATFLMPTAFIVLTHNLASEINFASVPTAIMAQKRAVARNISSSNISDMYNIHLLVLCVTIVVHSNSDTHKQQLNFYPEILMAYPAYRTPDNAGPDYQYDHRWRIDHMKKRTDCTSLYLERGGLGLCNPGLRLVVGCPLYSHLGTFQNFPAFRAAHGGSAGRLVWRGHHYHSYP